MKNKFRTLLIVIALILCALTTGCSFSSGIKEPKKCKTIESCIIKTNDNEFIIDENTNTYEIVKMIRDNYLKYGLF